MLLISLVPVWAFTYFPSQDGPAHLGTAATLLDLRTSKDLLAQVYRADWDFSTNEVYPALLRGLGSFAPLLLVEKLLLSLYVVGLPLASLYACRLSGGAAWAAYLAFPLIYTLPLYMGFYNLCFGLPLFVLTLGYYAAYAKAPSLRRGAVLSGTLLALYFVHLLPALCAAAVIALAAVIRASRRRAVGAEPFPVAYRLKQSGALLSLVPVTIVALSFLASFRQHTELPPRPAPEVTGLKASLPQPLRAIVSPVVNPLSPYRKAVYLLDGFSKTDRLYTLPYALLLAALSVLALSSVRRHRGLSEQAYLLVPVLAALGVLAVAPERYGPIGWLPGRLWPLVALLVTFWLSQTPLPVRVWRWTGVAALVITSFSAIYRLPVHAQLSAVTKEYVSAAAQLEPNTTVLPVHLGARYQHEGLKPQLQRAKFDAINHAAGYLSLAKPLVNLRNYQPARPYFPLQYRRGYDPRIYLSPDDETSRFESFPLHLDLNRFRERTGAAVDYVLLWGDPERTAFSDVGDLYAQLDEYTLKSVSSPRGLMRVYERR